MFTSSRLPIAAIFSTGTFTLLLAGCAGYQITLNERPIGQTPAELLQTSGVPDTNLASCIQQTVEDHRIHSTDQLTTLICTHAGIESLEGIQQFVNLEQVSLKNNALTSVAILSQLERLERLDLEGNAALNCAHLTLIRRRIGEQLAVNPPAHCQ